MRSHVQQGVLCKLSSLTNLMGTKKSNTLFHHERAFLYVFIIHNLFMFLSNFIFMITHVEEHFSCLNLEPFSLPISLYLFFINPFWACTHFLSSPHIITPGSNISLPYSGFVCWVIRSMFIIILGLLLEYQHLNLG